MSCIILLLSVADTTFNFTDLTVATDHLPAAATGDALANLTVSVSVTVANTGTVAGATPVMVAYSKQTRHVIRNLRDMGE